MSIRTEGVIDAEISAKRMYLGEGFRVFAECEECGTECLAFDGTNHSYLSYPIANSETELYSYCDECGEDFEVPVFLKVELCEVPR